VLIRLEDRGNSPFPSQPAAGAAVSTRTVRYAVEHAWDARPGHASGRPSANPSRVRYLGTTLGPDAIAAVRSRDGNPLFPAVPDLHKSAAGLDDALRAGTPSPALLALAAAGPCSIELAREGSMRVVPPGAVNAFGLNSDPRSTVPRRCEMGWAACAKPVSRVLSRPVGEPRAVAQ
jgi:hypothetical protein